MAETADQNDVTARWLPDTAPPTGVRAARQRWAAALRRAITLLMESDAPEEDLMAAAAALEAFNQRLEGLPHRHRLFGYAETATAGRPDALFDSSPVTGAANPLAPPLVLRQEGTTVRGTAVFGSAYEGPPGHVHGGHIAAAFDELLGMAQSLSGQRGMTGTLTVRYRRPTPLGRPLDFAAQLDRVEGRKIFVSGTLHAAGVLCAEADGVFVAVDFARLARLAAEQP
jgi:acyl-coenzyme A thioesterase PaaI-like protein